MRTIFRGRRLIDGTGTEPLDSAGVAIEDDRILAVGPSDRLSHDAGAP